MWTLRDPLVRDLTKGSLPRLAAGLGGEDAPGRREPVPERRSMSSVPHQERSSERRSGRAGRWRRNRPYGRRSTDHEPQDGWRPALAILLVVALLDWATKAVVAAAVPLGGFVEVWPGRVALWHVKNPEMVLGLWGNLPLGGRQAIAVMAAVVGLLALYEIIGRGHRLPPHRRRWAWLFVGLAFGGMLGNLGERGAALGGDRLSLLCMGQHMAPARQRCGPRAARVDAARAGRDRIRAAGESAAAAGRRGSRSPSLQRLIRPSLIRLRRLAGARGGRLSSPRTRTPPEN
jgi:lipoprotein signal peptidase